MKFFTKDFFKSVQARIVIFGKQDDNDELYCEIASLLVLIPPCNCPIFFLFIFGIMKVFVKDCCKTMQARVVIFGKQVDNDILYSGIANQPSYVYSSLYLCDFLSIF